MPRRTAIPQERSQGAGRATSRLRDPGIESVPMGRGQRRTRPCGLIDGRVIDLASFDRITAVSFPSRNGVWMGPPPDDRAAIDSLREMIDDGLVGGAHVRGRVVARILRNSLRRTCCERRNRSERSGRPDIHLGEPLELVIADLHRWGLFAISGFCRETRIGVSRCQSLLLADHPLDFEDGRPRDIAYSGHPVWWLA